MRAIATVLVVTIYLYFILAHWQKENKLVINTALVFLKKVLKLIIGVI